MLSCPVPVSLLSKVNNANKRRVVCLFAVAAVVADGASSATAARGSRWRVVCNRSPSSGSSATSGTRANAANSPPHCFSSDRTRGESRLFVCFFFLCFVPLYRFLASRQRSFSFSSGRPRDLQAAKLALDNNKPKTHAQKRRDACLLSAEEPVCVVINLL